jgi:integrase
MGRTMQPIRKKEMLDLIEKTLAARTDEQGRRAFLLWEVGIRSGMRISDMLQLRVGDLRRQKRYTYLPIKQRHKAGARPITIPIESGLREVIEDRCHGMDDGDYLFLSAERDKKGDPKPISRMTAYRDMKWIQKVCHIDEPMGCHTTRKTFGYHYYQQSKDVANLQTWFYHSSPETTLIYIGVAEDNLRKMTDKSPFSTPTELRRRMSKNV